MSLLISNLFFNKNKYTLIAKIATISGMVTMQNLLQISKKKKEDLMNEILFSVNGLYFIHACNEMVCLKASNTYF